MFCSVLLLLCRTLAGRMRGTIGFVDSVPHGTVMTLRVPTNRPTALTAAAAADDAAVQQTDALTSALAAKAAADSSKQFELLLKAKRILVSCLIITAVYIVLQSLLRCYYCTDCESGSNACIMACCYTSWYRVCSRQAVIEYARHLT
jgi:hypothetical protein